jgi:hypothetical protein
MQRSSTSVGTLAAALAKAQSEIANPEKSLTATIVSPFPREGSRTFRYAPLSSGLDLARKCLGEHEIAMVQATAIDQDTGLIRLTTTLVHASGEWVSSDWPVCPVCETATPHRMGAALTYARRYALFTLVGIAGDDDLDAPDLAVTAGPSGAHNRPTEPGNGRWGLAPSPTQTDTQPLPSPRRRPRGEQPKPANFSTEASASLRDQLISELEQLGAHEAVAAWAQRALPLKNQLSATDAQAVEAAFEAQLSQLGEAASVSGPKNWDADGADREPEGPEPKAQTAAPISKPVRERDRDHLRFVASQPCLVCGRTPSDAHHLRFAEPRAMGRKVSDRFAVPICRLHHRELHRRGNERAWWQSQGIEPLVIAADLWGRRHAIEPAAAGLTGGPDELNEIANGATVAGPPQVDETKPILGLEAE